MKSALPELERRFDVLDMMLTAHVQLRDRYSRYAAALNIAVFAATAVLLMTALIDTSVFETLAIDPGQARVAIASLAVVAALLAFLQLLVNWAERSGEHRRAAIVLARLKARCRELKQLDGAADDAVDALAWMREVDDALSQLAPIPDDQFTRLKAIHKRKVEISRLLDSYPSVPTPVLRAYLTWRDLRLLGRSALPPKQ